MHGERGHCVAGGDAREAVGDARDSDEVRRRHGARPGFRPLHSGSGGDDEFARRELALRKIDLQRLAVALQLRALGPGDRVGAAVGRIGRVHHAEHRHALAQQRDRDRRAAPPGEELERAVVRIDEPGPAGPGTGSAPRLFTDEIAIDEATQRFPQAFLDLLVDRAVAALAARAAVAIELGAQPIAFRFDGGDHGGKAHFPIGAGH